MRQARPGMGGRRTNLALLILVPLALLTGLFANTIGTDWRIDPATVHGTVAVAIALLSPWKSAVIRRGWRRHGTGRWDSVGLLILIAVTLTTGVVHAAGYRGGVGAVTVMQLHVGAAVVALVLTIVHYRAHPVRIRRQDLSRRTLLRSAGLAAAATLIVGGWEIGLEATGAKGRKRRFTGSHEVASFRPDAMPVTSWLDDRVPAVDREGWVLVVGERSFTFEEVMALPRRQFTAVIDCTSAWYSEQRWSGLPLDQIVDPASCRSVEVRSITGYARRFPSRDFDKTWLVTHVGGQPLSPGHGYPARIVAEDRRGFWCVKWVASITPSQVPWWVQAPFPVT